MPEPTPHRPGQARRPLLTPSEEVQQLLRRYLELRIRSLEREERERRESERRERMRSEVGRLVTAVLALLVYAGVLGALAQSTLVAALFNPQKLGHDLTAAGTVVGDLARLIPDALRAVVFSAMGALVLLVLRSASLNIRSEVGGAVCAGAVTLSLAGLASAAVTSPLGAMAAVPGFVAAVVVVHELLDVIRGIQDRRRHRSWLLQGHARRLEPLVRRSRMAIDVRGRLRLRVAYVAVVPVALACVGAAVAVRGGPLFLLGLGGFAGLAVWFTWACILTPPWARIPLWSMVPWALFFFSLLVTGPVAVLFSLSIMATLAVNAVLLTLRPEAPPAPPVRLAGGGGG